MPLFLLSVRLSTASLLKNSSYRALRQLPRHASSSQQAGSKYASNAGRPIRNVPGSFRPELTRFMNKTTPTPLVLTSSPIAYRIGSYMLATFCFAFTAINYFAVLYDPPRPLSNFVKGTWVSLEVSMAVAGVCCLLRTRRIVSSVSVVSNAVNVNTGQKGLGLILQTHWVVPGLRRKAIEIPADDVHTSDRLGVPGSYTSTLVPPTHQEWKEEQRWIRQQRRKEHGFGVGDILATPFRVFGQLLVRVFMGLRDITSDDGFVHLRIKGWNGVWKVDRDFIWALDNGHAFDQVVKPEVF